MLSAVGQIMTQKPISSQKKYYFLTPPNGNRSMDKMLPCITRSFQTVPVIWRVKTSHLTIIVSKCKANYVFEWQKSSNKFIICNIEMIMQNVTWMPICSACMLLQHCVYWGVVIFTLWKCGCLLRGHMNYLFYKMFLIAL